MTLKEVTEDSDIKIFNKVPFQLYKNDPFWVGLQEQEINKLFDPNHNSLLINGKAKRWVLIGTDNELIGRIAAFYEPEKANTNDQPTGGIGFFECVNNQDAANTLFYVAKKWLEREGMQAMDGSINFGENYVNWGVLTSGFIHPGFGMPYNHSWYKELFINYGFRTYFRQFTFHLTSDLFPADRFIKIASRINKDSNFTTEFFDYRNKMKYIQEFTILFNEIWSSFKEDYTPLTLEDIKNIFEEIRPIMDKDLICFAYHCNRPIAIVALLPDVNQILKHLNGKMNIWSKLKFIWLKKRGIMNRARVILFGVIPEFRKSGIESVIASAMFKKISSGKYKEIELGWVGDFNPGMLSVVNSLGAYKAKEHQTFRYLFDQNKTFKRYPIPESRIYEKLSHILKE